jgi:peptidoglycan/LPS O-acetylase OafA/YrhL
MRMDRPGFRPDIEGLRAVAILLVAGYHAGVPGLDGGYIGVDVFFVLSGYLITGLLVRELEAKGRVDLSRFYARRARRLLPAAALVLAVTVLAGRLFLSPVEMRELGSTALATSLYVSNIHFMRNATDYLAAAAHDNPLLHTWSLAVEEQFYFVWPLLVTAGYVISRRRAGRGPLIVLLGGVGLLSLIGSLWFTQRLQPWAFFGSPFRAWEFAAGGLAALAPRLHVRPGAAATLLGWAGLVLIGVAAITFHAQTPFPGSAALLPTAGTLLVLLACGQAPRRGAGRMLGLAPMQRIGTLSYSWYLWHWPVLVYAAEAGAAQTLPLRLMWVLVALWLADVTYRHVENPVRHHRSLARPAVTAAVAVVLTLSTAGWSGVWRWSAARAADLPEQRAYTEAYEQLPPNYSDGCHVAVLDDDGPTCAFGDTTAADVVVLFGDSHAAQWLPAFEQVGHAREWKVVPLTKSECPAASAELFLPRLGRNYAECARWRERMLERIAALQPKLVILASSHAYASESAASYRVSPGQWRDGTRRTLDVLARAGIATALLRDTPRPGFVVPVCLARAAWTPIPLRHPCVVSRAVAVDTLVHGAELEAARHAGDVPVLDLTDALCEADLCSSVRDGIVVFKDSNHLSAAFSAHLADALNRELMRHGL